MRTCVSVRTCYRTPRRHRQAAMNPSCQPQQGPNKGPQTTFRIQPPGGGRKSSTYREEETTAREEATNPGLDGFISNALNTEATVDRSNHKGRGRG